MAAYNAELIFHQFQSMRDGSGSQTPEQLLEDYCKRTLTSVEADHFDYKTKQDARTSELEESDKRNLAKAISGFANSGGGVLLWGIKEGSSLQLKPIAQIETFLKNLLELGGLATNPAVQGLDGYCLPSASDSNAGFAAIFIPESPLPPHRVVLKIPTIQNHYYIRSGSSFVVAAHSQLEDMFGRRPRPKLTIKQKGDFLRTLPGQLRWRIVFDVVNEGRGIAKHVCLQFPSGNGRSSPLVDAGESMWRSHSLADDLETGRHKLTCELHPDRVIHPGMAIRFEGLDLQDPYRPGEYVKIDGTLRCEGTAPVPIVIEGTLQP